MRVTALALMVAAGCSAPASRETPPLGGPATPAARPSPVATSEPTPAVSVAPNPPQVAESQPEPAPALAERRGDMLLVPAGSFMMGATAGGERDEHPAHQVTLAAFYLDETEVTNEAYAKAVAAGICPAPHPASAKVNGYGPDRRFRGPRQPVSSISWDSAKAYCEWAGKRLPTEAEWEKAARGDDGRRYPWGNDEPTEEHGRFGASVTVDVGSHPAGAGPYGHLDLAGNVWEWVADVYDPYAYRRDGASEGRGSSCEQSLQAFDELRRKGQQGFTGSNPIPTECERVLRGGAFNYHAQGLRVTNRVHHPGRYRLVMSGFRCALRP